jgi:pyruvate/2-oxoacid:ferredoxin oxidoreductase alpha subunit
VYTNKGRIDAVLKRAKKVIVVEIKYGKGSKLEKMIEEAMEQIRNKKYYEKYAGRDISLLAVAFGEDKEIVCKLENI